MVSGMWRDDGERPDLGRAYAVTVARKENWIVCPVDVLRATPRSMGPTPLGPWAAGSIVTSSVAGTPDVSVQRCHPGVSAV